MFHTAHYRIFHNTNPMTSQFYECHSCFKPIHKGSLYSNVVVTQAHNSVLVGRFYVCRNCGENLENEGMFK